MKIFFQLVNHKFDTRLYLCFQQRSAESHKQKHRANNTNFLSNTVANLVICKKSEVNKLVIVQNYKLVKKLSLLAIIYDSFVPLSAPSYNLIVFTSEKADFLEMLQRTDTCKQYKKSKRTVPPLPLHFALCIAARNMYFFVQTCNARKYYTEKFLLLFFYGNWTGVSLLFYIFCSF